MSLVSWLSGIRQPISSTRRLTRQTRRSRRTTGAVCRLEALESRTLLSAVSWDGGGGDLNWGNADNWSGGVLPGASDDVTIDIPGFDATILNASGSINSLTSSEAIVIQGGTLDIAAASSIASLTQFGGTLTGTGDIDIAGDYVWQTGTLSGASTLTVHGRLELQESGAFNNFWQLNERTLVNLGSGHATGLFGPAYTTAMLFFHAGAELHNAGSFDIETTVGMRFILADGTGSRIVNSGSFTNATNDVSSVEGISFENSGNLMVPNGQLQLQSGFTNIGNCHIDSGTTLLVGGLFESTADITGSGLLHMQYATQSGSVSTEGNVTLEGTTIEGDFAVGGDLRVLGASFNGTPVTIGGSVSIEGGWNGSGEVTIGGLMTWNIGAWITGTGTIVANGGMHITGTGLSRLTGMTIENAGMAVFDGGLIEGYNGSVIHNLPGATFEIRNDADMYDIGGAAQVRFDNDGTFLKLTGPDVASVNFQFNNNGLVEVQSGQLQISGGGGTSTGDFLVGTGATLFASGEFSATSDITGTGNLTLFYGTQRGTVNIGGDVTLDAVTIEGDFAVAGDMTLINYGATFNGTPATVGGVAAISGHMGGTGDVTIAGVTTWDVNYWMLGTGRTIATGGINMINGQTATSARIVERTIINGGVGVFNEGQIFVLNGAIFWNLPGASLELKDGASIDESYNGVPSQFINEGTITKTTGSGTAALNIKVSNNGAVDVQSGTLLLGGGGTSSGSFMIGSGATLSAGGILQAGSSVTGAGNLELYSAVDYGTIDIGGNVTLYGVTIEGDFAVAGDLTQAGGGAAFNGTPATIGGAATVTRMHGTGDVTIIGLLTWNLSGGPQMTGSGRTIANGGLYIAGSETASFISRTIVNAGVAVFDGGTISASGGAIFRNLSGASFEIRNDADIHNQYNGDTPLFDNHGTFLKLTGAGTAQVAGIPFNNNGTVNVQSGTLLLSGGGTSNGSYLIGSGATLSAGGILQAGSSVTGAGNLELYSAVDYGTIDIGGNVTLYGVTIEGDFAVGGNLSIPEGSAATFNGTPATIGGNATVNRMIGTGDVTIAGLFTWDLNGVAQMLGTGSTIANGGMLFVGSGQAFLQQRTIVNAGNAIWTGAAINIANTAQIINSGTFNIQSDGPFNNSSECPSFINAGQLIKSAGNGTTFLNMMLVNSGSVIVQTGILNIGCGYVPDGGIVVGLVETSEIVNPGSLILVPSPPITVGNFIQTSTGQLFEQIGGLIPGLEYGQIAVNGNVSLDGTLHVTLVNGFTPHLGDQFTVINNMGTQPINGSFIGLPEGTTFYSGLYGFTISYVGGDGNELVLTMDHLANTPPVANIGGPYSVPEGGSVILTAGGSHDAEQAANTLTYEWDLDGDGIFGESGINAGRGSEIGVSPMFSASGLDGPSTFTVSVRVTDSYGQSDIANAIIAITNVAPTVTTLASANADILHRSLDGNVTINGAFFDPAQAFDTYTVIVNWGDGEPVETLPGSAVNQSAETFLRTHHYAGGGIFTVTVTVRDEDGGVSAQSTTTAVVTGVGVVNGTLYIIGTDGKDTVNLTYKQNTNQLKVDARLNQNSNGGSDGGFDGGGDRIQQTYQASSITRIVAYLLGGNDTWNGSGSGGSDGGSDGGGDLSIRQIVLGGTGNDTITGGSGNDALIGGSGDDVINGGGGRDIVIGSIGKDTLHGNAGDDLLIGGSTANQDYLAALDQALTDWGAGNLNATLADLGLITDDGNKDDISGDQGNDTLVGGTGDKLKQ